MPASVTIVAHLARWQGVGGLRLLTVIIIMALPLGGLSLVMSQTPDLAQAAREAAATLLPGGARLTSLSELTANSTALGCDLIGGLPLPDPIIVYRYAFAHDDGDVHAHISADGSLAQVCDARYARLGRGVQPVIRAAVDSDGDSIQDEADSCPMIAGIATAERPGCPETGDGDSDGDGAEDGRDRCPTQAGSAASEGCPLMQDSDGDGAPDQVDICPMQPGSLQPGLALGCPADGSGISSRVRPPHASCRVIGEAMPVYASRVRGASVNAQLSSALVMGISAALDWLHVPEGWIKAAGTRLLGDCYNLPLVNPERELASACYMQPSGERANIRQGPHGRLMGSLDRHEQVAAMGRNAAGSWLMSREGWLSRSVLELTGECEGLPVLDPTRAASGVIRFCPPDYAGSLPPRITRAPWAAKLVSSRLANRLRAQPHITAAVIGEIPAGSVIEAVLDGPSCQAPYVWWQVSSGGQVGWTAESDFNAYHYYLAPHQPGDEDAKSAIISLSAGLSAQSHRLIHSANLGGLAALAELPLHNPVGLAWSALGTRLAVLSDGGELTVIGWPDMARSELARNVSAMAISADGNWLALGDGAGQIRLMDMESGSTVSLGELAGPVRGLAWSGAGDRLAAISGDDKLTLARRAGALRAWHLEAAAPQTSQISADFHFPYPLTAVAFSHDGRWLAVSGESQRHGRAALWVYEAASAAMAFSRATIASGGQALVVAAPAALGDFVYSGGDSLLALELPSGDIQRIYHQARANIRAAAFRDQVLPGGEALLALAELRHDGERLALVNALNAHSPDATYALAAADLAFHPDGQLLALAEPSRDRALILGIAAD